MLSAVWEGCVKRFGNTPPTRDYHLASYVMEVTNNSSRDDRKFEAAVASVRQKAAGRNFNAAQMARLEQAITDCTAMRERAA